MNEMHCFYIIISTEFKEKHNLEQDELFCCVIISSELKEKVNSRKNIYFCFIDYAKAFDHVDHNKLRKILKRDENTRPLYLQPEKPLC